MGEEDRSSATANLAGEQTEGGKGMRKSMHLLLVLVLLVSILVACGPVETAAPQGAAGVAEVTPAAAAGGAVYEVVYPLGKLGLEVMSPAPSIPDLNGKTVCELWHAEFQGDITFPVIRELLQKQFPDVNIIPYTEFEASKVTTEIPGVVAQIKEKGCNVVIGGNGG
jgi:hypothetical protein